MKSLLLYFLSVLTLGAVFSARAQLSSDTELYQLLRSRDSLLFHAAFNSCDANTLEQLFTEDFEFYHDKSGVTTGREEFVAPFRKECAAMVAGTPQAAKRILLPTSLEVFPLYKNGVLYGAIQHGMHRFEFLNEEKHYQQGDIARFTHVWVIEGSDWKIKRELSYDHQPNTNNHQSSSN